MKNIDFLRYISAPIVNVDGNYYAYVSAVFGYRNGYNKGLYAYLCEEMLNQENLNEYFEAFDDYEDPNVVQSTFNDIKSRLKHIENHLLDTKISIDESLINIEHEDFKLLEGEDDRIRQAFDNISIKIAHIEKYLERIGLNVNNDDLNLFYEKYNALDVDDNEDNGEGGEETGGNNEAIADKYYWFSNNVDTLSPFMTVDNYDLVKCIDHCLSVNYIYYAKLNEIGSKFSFSEDDMLDFRSTFARLILEYAFVTDISLKTQIYKKVLNYYANGMTDDVKAALDMMMTSSSLSYVMTDSASTSTCGCNSGSGGGSGGGSLTVVESPGAAYEQAMELYMKQMFADLDFYWNFFFLDVDKPNEYLIDRLIELLESLLNSDYLDSVTSSGGSGSGGGNKLGSHCCCSSSKNNKGNNGGSFGSGSGGSGLGMVPSAIIENYINVLKWVRNCEIDENSNKIKLYGELFGNLFAYLSF